MANLIIKPADGGSLILQDEGGDTALTVGTTGNTTLAGTANNLGTATAGTLSSGITYPTGHILQTKGSNNYHAQTFDTDQDVVIEISLSNVLASSHVAIWTTCTICNSASSSGSNGEGFEGYVYRHTSSMGAVGANVTAGTKVNATGGNTGSATFNYMEAASSAYNSYNQAAFFCIATSPATGTNYFAFVGSGYSSTTPQTTHDGNCSILVMEIAQ